jgi:hypothetical protein
VKPDQPLFPISGRVPGGTGTYTHIVLQDQTAAIRMLAGPPPVTQTMGVV